MEAEKEAILKRKAWIRRRQTLNASKKLQVLLKADPDYLKKKRAQNNYRKLKSADTLRRIKALYDGT